MKILSQSIKLSSAIEFEFTHQHMCLEQIEMALPKLVRSFVQSLFWNACLELIERYKKETSNISLVHFSRRKVLTAFGEMEIPDYEVRIKRKYQGRTAQLVFGLQKKQACLTLAKEQLTQILPMLSFRKTSKFLGLFWGKTNHQRLHAYFKNFDFQESQEKIQTLKKFSEVRKVLAWMDGFCLKVRVKRGAEVMRTTLRVGVSKIRDKSQKIFRIACGFLEESYDKIFRKIVQPKDFTNAVCLTDGERHIENGLKKLSVKHIQRCLFHFFYNFIGKCTKDKIPKEYAEELKQNLYKLIFMRVPYLKQIKQHWKKVLMERLNVLDDLDEQLRGYKFHSIREYIQRARPYLFTHVYFYLEQNFFIGRTTNKIERLMRALAYRMKRIGAIWSPDGAKKMANLIIANHFNISNHYIKPVDYHISTLVVKT